MKSRRNSIAANVLKSILIGAVAILLELVVFHFFGENANSEIICWAIMWVTVVWISLLISSSDY